MRHTPFAHTMASVASIRLCAPASGEISAQEAMSDACNAKALLWDLMPMGMVGIDGDEHIDAAMRVAASDGDRCAL